MIIHKGYNSRSLVAIVLACALATGCERAPAGTHCYTVSLVFDGPTFGARGFYRIPTGQGDLAGWVAQDQNMYDCWQQIMRVTSGQADEILCVPHDPTGEQRQIVGPVAGDLGAGLYLMGTLPLDARFDNGTLIC